MKHEWDRRLGLSVSAACLALLLVTAGSLRGEAEFLRGDANADGTLDVGDAVRTLLAVYVGGTPLTCADAADTNDDGKLTVGDPLFTLTYLFIGGAAPRPPSGVCGLDPTADSLSCAAHLYCEGNELPRIGQSEFETPLAYWAWWNRFGGPGMAEDAAGPPAPGAEPAAPAPGAERKIEESDIYKIQGPFLFALNRYRGLQVIDLSDLANPDVVGQLPVYGNPKEMYVRGDKAFIIVSDFLRFSPVTDVGLSPIPFYGSVLRIVDISDPTNPTVESDVELRGQYQDSRIVGDILYLVADHSPNNYYSPLEQKVQVLSVDIGDPGAIRLVESRDFPRRGWEQHLNVTAQSMYVADSIYDWQSARQYQTTIQYVDISDPAGAIRVRGKVNTAGMVRDRWSMDEHLGVLRVAASQSWGNGDVYLSTFSVSNPDELLRLGGYTMRVNETITASAFDGTRGYVVTYRNIDPLFTFDLSDPKRPRLMGELEMTGWLDFMVPLGDRIVALGHEDILKADGSRDRSLAVSLVDVADLAKPTLLSRVQVGADWGQIPAERDDFAKVFRVLPEDGMLLFPFHSWDWRDWRSTAGVQLIDFSRERLTKRGLITDAGWVERGIPYPTDNVLTLSSEVFQALDIRDRDVPRLLSRLELARNVASFAPLPDGQHAVQLAGDWALGELYLVVTELDDPNSVRPTARIFLPAPYGRMFINGSMVYLLSVEPKDAAQRYGEQVTVARAIDFSNPRQPAVRGSVQLPELIWPSYGYWMWGSGDEVVQVNGSTLALHRNVYSWWGPCRGCDVLAVAEGVAPPGPVESPDHTVVLLDMANADAPKVASRVTIPDVDWCWGLQASAQGSTIYLSSYRARYTEDNLTMAKYLLHRIDAADPANPVQLPVVNTPGMFLGAREESNVIYTLENRWDKRAQAQRNVLYALELRADDKAYVLSLAEIAGSINGIQIDGQAAVAVSHLSELALNDQGQQTWTNRSKLFTVDLGDPSQIAVAGEAELPQTWPYLREVEGGRAFLGFWDGILSYQVSDLKQPSFEKFFRTQGWPQELVVDGDKAYLPSGYYGVQVLDLSSR